MLGTNGRAGSSNVNSAHPSRIPTGSRNFYENASWCWRSLPGSCSPTARWSARGARRWRSSRRCSSSSCVAVTVALRRRGARLAGQARAGLHTQVVADSTGGNLEGRSSASASAGSALFDVVRRSPRAAQFNSSIESFTGLGGCRPVRQPSARARVIFGGVGTGLYSILLYVLLAVFLGGLMVGRSRSTSARRSEAREIKLVALGLLITPLTALFSTALATASAAGRASISTVAAGGPQGFSRPSTPTSRKQNNNGSAFAGYNGLHPAGRRKRGSHGVTFADLLGGFTALFARYAPILFALAVAGALAGKRVSPVGLGTMRTDNRDVRGAADRVIILVGALTFFPALLLGPVVQALTGHLYH